VNVGESVSRVSAGATQTCVVTVPGNVRCWGSGLNGQLGYGNLDNIGDDETPATAGNVSAF
jgi:alpha-tubulin suppressor-like RCC1 family protein